MRFRHAAALALVGWYLVLTNGDAKVRVFPETWSTIQHSFDTAKECEDARAKAVIPPQPTLPGVPTKSFFCVASDDPRLKGPPP